MAMKEQTFEEFLQETHANVYTDVLDDDLSDHFDNWLGELDGEQWLRYGTLYGQQQLIAGKEQVIDIFNKK